MNKKMNKMGRMARYGLAALVSGIMAYQSIRHGQEATEALATITPVERQYLNAMESYKQAIQNTGEASREWWSAWIDPNGETLDVHRLSQERYNQYVAMLQNHIKPYLEACDLSEAKYDSIKSSAELE